MLRFSLLCLSLAVGLSTALPLEELESMPNPNNPDEMMYYVPAEKRSPIGQANQLRDLLHALEMEATIEEAEENGRPVDEERGVVGVEDGPGLPPAAGLESTHSVDKRRRRRYGFWVTAINKMGNMKRSGSHFIPALGGRPRAKKFVTGNMRSAVRG